MNTEASARRGLWVAGGSILTALVASACCWIPLLLVSFGASAAGLSAEFERLRPLFLSVTVLLLGAGFYFTYFRGQKRGADADDCCAVPRPRFQRLNRALLWMATAVVVAIASFPEYVTALTNAGGRSSIDEVGAAPQVVLAVDGMTCEACTMHVNRALRGVPGVLDSEVDFEAGRARINVDALAPPTSLELTRAVAEVGYTARVVDGASHLNPGNNP